MKGEWTMNKIQVWSYVLNEFPFLFFHCSVELADPNKLGMEKPPLSVRNLEDDRILVAEKNSLMSPFGARVTLEQGSESCVGIMWILPCSAAEGLGAGSIFARRKHDPLHDRLIPVFAKPLIFM